MAWRERSSQIDTLLAREPEEQEEIVLATFDVDEIRRFRAAETWRLNYRKAWYRAMIV